MIRINFDDPTAQMKTTLGTVAAGKQALVSGRQFFASETLALVAGISALTKSRHAIMSGSTGQYTEAVYASAPTTRSLLNVNFGIDRSELIENRGRVTPAKTLHS